ncbi:HAD family phosphatase [Desulfuromonas carbonis]|uniref:HAD family hydrolase n=1 Tax=Desulfuromonas sp. DDH964 TaxID=1823759 RepID=UPI00078B9107|nr:HAD family phosphatase [Desulfuromonas sp. DDH964]AMV72746.1 HAD superfamily hydrolase [Desulfuromonas sp. DDH964]
MDWIFWDNDGVLVATEDLYFQASAEALGLVGIDLDLADFRTISLQRGESVFQLATGTDLGAWTIDALRDWRDRRYSELLAAGAPLQPAVIATLEALHGQVRMAIVTSSRRHHFEAIHRHSGLLPYFEFCLVREDYHHSKPHPEPYRLALSRSGARPERCLVIEDSPRGAEAALGAGLSCLVIPGAMNAGGPFHTGCREIRSLAEIPGLLGLSHGR